MTDKNSSWRLFNDISCQNNREGRSFQLHNAVQPRPFLRWGVSANHSATAIPKPQPHLRLSFRDNKEKMENSNAFSVNNSPFTSCNWPECFSLLQTCSSDSGWHIVLTNPWHNVIKHWRLASSLRSVLSAPHRLRTGARKVSHSHS